MKKIFTIVLAYLLSTNTIHCQELLYGVAYYHEYMPQERLDEDIKLMKSAGINVVRLAESSWALLEPKDGQFDFVWLDRIVNKMSEGNIKVIIGTPTYSIPAWMYKKHPDILVEHIWGGKFNFGGRCTHDITNKNYLYYAERIIKAMAERYAKHPNIIGFQIDNETKTNFLGSNEFYEGLKSYVKNKYGTVDNLNKSWGLNYWSQTLGSWDELPSQKGTVFLGYKLDMERYRQSLITNFLHWQSDLVSKYKRKDQFITHNFDNMDGAPHPGVRQDEIGQYLDVMGTDIYHSWQNDFSGMEISLCGDYFRSVKNKNYFVIETNAQTTLLGSQTPPSPNQLRLAYFSHLASGASMVSYWHWHSTHSGAEVYWRGLLSQDLKPNRLYNEASIIGNEIKLLSSHLSGLKVSNSTAILYSHDAFAAVKEEEYSKSENYQSHFKSVYRNLFQMNIGTDIITNKITDLKKYRTLIVPMLYVSSDTLLDNILNFAKSGGHVILTPRSGFENQNGYVRTSSQPGKISDVAGVYYQEFTTLNKPVSLVFPTQVSQNSMQSSIWAELLTVKDAEVLMKFKDGFLKDYAAATTKSVGKGSVTYIGTILDDFSFQTLMTILSKKYNLTDISDELPKSSVVIKNAINSNGKKVHFFFNYSDNTQNCTYSFGAGKSLTSSNLKISKGNLINLPAWGLEIIEE